MPDGTFGEEHIDHIIDALHAVKFARRHYGSSKEGADIIMGIVNTLRGTEHQRSYVIFGNAILKSITSGPVDDKG